MIICKNNDTLKDNLMHILPAKTKIFSDFILLLRNESVLLTYCLINGKVLEWIISSVYNPKNYIHKDNLKITKL